MPLTHSTSLYPRKIPIMPKIPGSAGGAGSGSLSNVNTTPATNPVTNANNEIFKSTKKPPPRSASHRQHRHPGRSHSDSIRHPRTDTTRTASVIPDASSFFAILGRIYCTLAATAMSRPLAVPSGSSRRPAGRCIRPPDARPVRLTRWRGHWCGSPVQTCRTGFCTTRAAPRL